VGETRLGMTGLVDLAAARVGGKAVAANDEFFAPKQNLLLPGRGVFIDGKYTTRGKWMDGWETRRRRTPGHDWCIVRLGVPGVIRAFTVDTNHFRGNHPEACSIEAATVTGTGAQALTKARWTEVLARSPLQGHHENQFHAGRVADDRVTHVRLNIYPDGGVARLRVWGEARPDWRALARKRVDLVSVQHGGVPLAASDQFFSEPLNLLVPSRPANMGDGWETKRRRGPGHDWVIIRLGHRGTIAEVVVDTTHFKGNYPESCSVEACDDPRLAPTDLPVDRAPWRELIPRTKLRANAQHRFAVKGAPIATHVRLSIFPDGGVARLRVFGRPA
jgi:allantoicase